MAVFGRQAAVDFNVRGKDLVLEDSPVCSTRPIRPHGSATPDRLARVAVIGNAAVLRRPRAFRDLKAIGQELEAEYVVLAQVKSEGGRVRLIAHLIRTDDQAHVWAKTFDPPSFGLDVQAELAEEIARAVVDRLR